MILKWYKPDYIFARTPNITPQFLQERNIRCIFLDADGTLRRHKKLEAADGIMDWIDLMQKNGIKLFITSNNFKKKVQPFADIVKLPCVTFSAKPTPWGFIRARFKTKVPLKNTLVVGDQIFTDVMGANLSGMKCLMVLAILAEESAGFKFKRRIEKGFIEKYLKQQGGPL
jgi:HAD superfamily phosphatase (TIGR01668 family)